MQIPDRSVVIDYLLETGKVSREAVNRAEAVAGRTAQPLERVLSQLGQLSDDDLTDAYAEVVGAQIWNPATHPAVIDPEEVGLGSEFLKRVRVVPLRLDGEHLVCAAVDPFDAEMQAGLSFATGRSIVFALRVRRIGGT